MTMGGNLVGLETRVGQFGSKKPIEKWAERGPGLFRLSEVHDTPQEQAGLGFTTSGQLGGLKLVQSIN